MPELFDCYVHRYLIMWNSITRTYAELGESNVSLRLFHQMQLKGFSLTVISWNSLISRFLRKGSVG